MAVDHLDMPAVCGVTGADILALADIQHRVQGDVVGIKENDQVIESQMTCERGGFTGNTLLQAAVTAQGDDVVVEDGVLGSVEPRGGHLLRHGIADGIGDSLTERARGCLDARSLVKFGMAGGDAVKLAELLHLIKRQVESGEM